MAVSRKRETEALHLVRGLSTLVEQLTDVVTRSTLFDARLLKEGHVTASKILVILVDFQAWMEAIVKEMRQLVRNLVPNRAMDFTNFPEIPAFLEDANEADGSSAIRNE